VKLSMKEALSVIVCVILLLNTSNLLSISVLKASVTALYRPSIAINSGSNNLFLSLLRSLTPN
jgi:hypothetical protein